MKGLEGKFNGQVKERHQVPAFVDLSSSEQLSLVYIGVPSLAPRHGTDEMCLPE